MKLLNPVLLALTLMCFADGAIAQTVLDDGGSHVISDDIEQHWTLVDNATTLQFEGRRTFRDDGSIEDKDAFGAMDVRNGSTLLFNGIVEAGNGGGGFQGVVISSSNIEINGGKINLGAEVGQALILSGDSRGSMSSGEVVVGTDANFTGAALMLEDTSQFIQEGGVIGFWPDTGVVNIGARASDESMLTVLGGEQRGVGTHFWASEDARIVVVDATSVARVDFEGRSRFFHTEGNSEVRVEGGSYLIDSRDESSVRPEERIAFQATEQSSTIVTGGSYTLTGRSRGIVAEDQSIVEVAGATFVYPKHEPSKIWDEVLTNTFFHASNDAKISVNHTSVTATTIADDNLVFFRSEGASEIHIAGGDYSVDSDDETGVLPEQRIAFHAADQSSIMVAGGKFTLTEKSIGIVAEDEGVVQIEGTDFNYPMFEAITDLEGTITGVLLDGNPFEMTFQRDPTATIVLIPEPSAITLSAFGFLGLLGCRRKKNAA